MALDYAVQPGPLQKLKPAFQNWRLYAFVAVLCVPFAYLGYSLLSFTLSNGIHQHGDTTSVDLKSLGNFPFDGVNGMLTDVPKDFRALDGKRVELTGMMWSAKSAGPHTNEFQLVYNIAKCCFGGPPKVQERVFVHTHGPIQFYDVQVNIVGTLHVRLKRDETGTVDSVYDLDLESVNPV
jgi:hypothetical protein